MILEKKNSFHRILWDHASENKNGFIKLKKDKDIRKEYVFETYKETIAFVNNIADLAEDEGHHPFIHINYKKVLLILYTHKINGLHENDFILASKCDLLYVKFISN